MTWQVGAALLQSELRGGAGEQALALTRVCMAAVFCCMATELAPPHTHSRRANLLYTAAFALGVGAASVAELVEGSAAAEDR
jgi:hypothetical protein